MPNRWHAAPWRCCSGGPRKNGWSALERGRSDVEWLSWCTWAHHGEGSFLHGKMLTRAPLTIVISWGTGRIRSFELQGSSYSAWLCGWESDNDMSKIWMPNSDLIATIDRLVRIRTENHTQGLGELLKPYIQGIKRWQSTIPSGWNFQILRLPRSSFINSDDGKMMIYTQQIGQNCNWHKDCLVVLWHVWLFCGAISSFVFAC